MSANTTSARFDFKNSTRFEASVYNKLNFLSSPSKSFSHSRFAKATSKALIINSHYLRQNQTADHRQKRQLLELHFFDLFAKEWSAWSITCLFS